MERVRNLFQRKKKEDPGFQVFYSCNECYKRIEVSLSLDLD